MADSLRVKLCLDLYNRRFEIYRHCVDFGEGLYPRNELARDSVTREGAFQRSYCASQRCIQRTATLPARTRNPRVGQHTAKQTCAW
jgi:hypothetical protein